VDSRQQARVRREQDEIQLPGKDVVVNEQLHEFIVLRGARP
jgi:hypothetical protein